ncbi:MAG TPA: GNAT family N-acetyltransferase [Nocardioidaceae bacterium]|nr:GNAT family N-acetyltransferase [Nocardioidaceae bacterium]
MSVRPACLDDVRDLARINIDAWRVAYQGIIPQSRIDAMDMATYQQRWSSYLSAQEPDTAHFVAVVNGVVAAYASGGPYRPQSGTEPKPTGGLAELYAIYADPMLQRRGAGTAVHDALINSLRDAGFAEVALWVLVENARSRAWYERRGWRPDGSTSVWVADGTGLPELRMRLDLSAASEQSHRRHQAEQDSSRSLP